MRWTIPRRLCEPTIGCPYSVLPVCSLVLAVEELTTEEEVAAAAAVVVVAAVAVEAAVVEIRFSQLLQTVLL